MSNLNLLWFDQTVSLQEAELPYGITDRCASITRLRDLTSVREHLEEQSTDVICMDFDYADRPGLRTLQHLKDAFPSTMMIMLTLQHSESLAIWAFRSRVWDYLVKPLSNNEITRCFDGLDAVLSTHSEQKFRQQCMPSQRIPAEASAPAPRSSEIALLPAVNFVEKHFRSKINSEEVGRLCGMSPYRFSKHFKDIYGIGFREYVLQRRLRESCRLLENPNATVSDVCYAVGFNDNSYFSRMFKKYVGVVPSEVVGTSVRQWNTLTEQPSSQPFAEQRHLQPSRR